MKVLTFVVPAYNSQLFLDKCIQSMLAPEILDKLEILVVNDGSTDTTAAIAEKYCARYPEVVRLICQENKGHGGALNTGCAAARGKYLKVIDADDWVQTQNLPAFVARLEQCDSDAVLTHYKTVDICTGETKHITCSPAEFDRGYTFDELMTRWGSVERSLTFHGITYRTAFYREYGIQLPEHVFYEDHVYATFPCCHAKSVTPVDLLIYTYRIGDVNQSVSEQNQLRRISHLEAVLKYMIRHFDTLRVVEPCREVFVAMKIQTVLLSYMTTALLVNPDKKAGRQLASAQMAQCRQNAPAVYVLAKWKYRVLTLMNRMHISKRTWENLLKTSLYSAVKKRARRRK